MEGESFMSPPSLKSFSFIRALSYFLCSRSICSTSLPRDRDITRRVQEGPRSVCSNVIIPDKCMLRREVDAGDAAGTERTAL